MSADPGVSSEIQLVQRRHIFGGLRVPTVAIAGSEIPPSLTTAISPDRVLINLPTEIIQDIGSYLDDLDHSALRMVCKTLLFRCGEPRSLGEEDYWAHNKRYEASHRARIHSNFLLLCTSCMKHLPRVDFQDSKSKKACDGMRICVNCSINCELLNNTAFTWHGELKFYCSGCKEVMPLKNKHNRPNEGSYIEQRIRAKANALRDGTKALEIDTNGRKWCSTCWSSIRQWERAKYRVAAHELAMKARRRERQRELRRRARNALAAQQ